MQVREGFIVDEDEDEEDDDVESRERRKKKKRRREREEEEQLDEEDLDLIGESIPEWERKTQPQVCFISSSIAVMLVLGRSPSSSKPSSSV